MEDKQRLLEQLSQNIILNDEREFSRWARSRKTFSARTLYIRTEMHEAFGCWRNTISRFLMLKMSGVG